MNETPLGTVVGWCDGYERGHVRGWAWFPRQPHETVTVELVVDGKVVGEAAACVARPDLKTAGIGHGRHAFAIPFTLPPHATQALRVRVQAKDGPVLNDGEFDIHTSPEELRQQALRASRGYLESVFGSLTTDVSRPQPGPPAKSQIHFILHCATGTGDIAAKLGVADYSYLFVMHGFRAVLRRMGIVHVVADPARDVAPIHAACRRRGEECVYFSFAPPHATVLGLACPTIPVIAWEFGTIPTAIWDSERRHDWRRVLRECGRAITISGYAAHVIARTMGPKFPVSGIPTPVWDRQACLRARIAPVPPVPAHPIALEGFIWDSRSAPFSLGMPIPPIPLLPARPRPSDPLRGWRLALAEAARAAEADAARRQEAVAALLAQQHAAWEARRAADAAAQLQAQADADALEAAEASRRAEAAALEAAAKPKTMRDRANLTRHMALAWYRDAVRDALPPVAARGIGAAGRLAWRARSGWQGPTPVAGEPHDDDIAASVEQPPPPAPLPQTMIPPPAPAPVLPRWHPASDQPPMPEPALAVFDPDPAPRAAAAPADSRAVLMLDGIVFTAVLAPKDGRKNWQDILSAFVFAFREVPEATLVFKMIGADAAFWWWEFHDIVTRLPVFACRVVVLHGYLDDTMYGRLIEATHWVTNASLAEGQCLPLVEFMSVGRPAVAPAHTAMADYITADNAMIVAADLEYCAWPHDPRNELVAMRYRVDWTSLRDAFTAAHGIATAQPERYLAMGENAARTMQRYCGDETVKAALEDILCLHASAAAPAGEMAA